MGQFDPGARRAAASSTRARAQMMFVGPHGDVVPSLTESEMREVDRVAIEETGPNLFQRMENAGRGLAVTALEMLDDLGDGPVVVLAGTGGNGGGGITAGRHLANRDVDVLVTVTDPTSLGEVPAFQLRVFDATQGKVWSGWMISME